MRRRRSLPRRLRRPVRRLGPEVLESRWMLTALPAGFREDSVVSGLAYPTAMAVAPDGRIFVAQKGGAIRVITDGVLPPKTEPFAVVPAERSYEYGLCGIALDPDFASNGYVYVNYIAKGTPTRNLIERFTADGSVARPGSQTTIFELDNVNPPGPTGNYHVGGALHFGTDGMLYVATGDNTTPANAQSLTNLHGKILRIAKDGSIPADNPFVAQATGVNRAIWAYGLRNPFTFAVQPGSGRILINDVGQNGFEEINLGKAGANYGWPLSEGPTTDPRFAPPLHAYADQATPRGAACIAGGAFYDPSVPAMPVAYVGRYFFADFNNAWMATLDPATGRTDMFATGLSDMPLDIDVAPDGSIYYLAWGDGMSVKRISYTGDLTPAISMQPANLVAAAGLSATFAVTAGGDGTLSYRWQRAAAGESGFVDLPDQTAVTCVLPNVALADSGARYRVVVSSVHGAVVSAAATLTVVANQPPIVTISSPTTGGLFAGGEVVFFAARAVDPESGSMPADGMRWQVDMLHGAVTRPVVPPSAGASGSFVIPDDTPYTRTDVIMRLTVTARDPLTGIAGIATVDLRPQIVTMSLRSDPPGLMVGLEGGPHATPFEIAGIAGMRRTISAAPFQANAAGFLRFVGWSHGGAASQVVVLPTTDVAYTASYAATGTFVDTFAAAGGGRFEPWSGRWSVDASGAYTAGGGFQAEDAVTVFAVASPRPAAYEIGGTISLEQSFGNAFLVFDAVAADDFKYVGLRGASGTMVVGRRTPAGWLDEAAVVHGLDVSAAVQLTVRVAGTGVVVRLAERMTLVHDFAESLADGGVGLATRKGIARFTRFFEGVAAHPRDVIVTGNSLLENAAPGTLVGLLQSRGWGGGATFRYELAPGDGADDNSSFVISGDRLESAKRFNFEERRSYSIRVRSTEATGVICETPLTIVIGDDPNETPVIDAVVVPSGAAVGVGAVLRLTLVLSCAVTVTGKPELPLQIAGSPRAAVYEAGSGTHRLTFAYQVKQGDPSGSVTLGNAVRLPARTWVWAPSGARLAPGLPEPGAVLPIARVDGVAPVAIGVIDAPPSGSYGVGSVLRFRVTFSEAVWVTGIPLLRLTLGGPRSRTVAALYESGSGTRDVTFRYDVKSEDATRVGTPVTVASTLALPPGAAILDAASNAARPAIRVPAGLRVRIVG